MGGRAERSARGHLADAHHGTYANVTIVTSDSAGTAAVAARAQQVFRRVDSLMSNWTTTSKVTRLNRLAGHETVVVHPEVAVVLD